jgi:hypothetical protein
MFGQIVLLPSVFTMPFRFISSAAADFSERFRYTNLSLLFPQIVRTVTDNLVQWS